MLKISTLSFISILILITIIGCYKDDVVQVKSEKEEVPKTFIQETDVIGTIQDGEGNYVFNRTTQFVDQLSTHSTHFVYKGNNVSKYGESFSIETSQGVTMTYPLLLLENQINYVNLKIQEDLDSKLYENTFLELEIEDDVYLEIQPNGIFDGDQLVTENTTIFYKDLSENSLDLYPTSMVKYVERTDFLLMDNVFYFSFGNEKLTVPSGLWKSSIERLYYFDFESQSWIEINLDDNLLSGFYATGKAVDGRFVELKLDNEPILENFSVNYSWGKYHGQARTTSEGKAIIFVPNNESINVSLKINESQLFTEDFLADVDEVKIDINGFDNWTTVEIEPIDCSGHKIENAVLSYENDIFSKYYFLDNRTAVNVFIGDEVNHSFTVMNKTEQSLKYLSSTMARINLGIQLLCNDEGENFLFIETDEGNQIFHQASSYIEGLKLIVEFENDLNNSIKIKIDNNGEGSYNNDEVNVLLNIKEGIGYEFDCFQSDIGCGTESFELIKLKTKTEEYYNGFIQGEYWIKNSDKNSVGYRTVKGRFQVKVP